VDLSCQTPCALLKRSTLHVAATTRGPQTSHPYRTCCPTTAALLGSGCMQCSKVADSCMLDGQGQGTTNQSNCHSMSNATALLASRSPMSCHEGALQMFKSTPSGRSKKKQVGVSWIARRCHKHATTGKGAEMLRTSTAVEQACVQWDSCYTRRGRGTQTQSSATKESKHCPEHN
jgi:hypothetical protein